MNTHHENKAMHIFRSKNAMRVLLETHLSFVWLNNSFDKMCLICREQTSEDVLSCFGGGPRSCVGVGLMKNTMMVS